MIHDAVSYAVQHPVVAAWLATIFIGPYIAFALIALVDTVVSAVSKG